MAGAVEVLAEPDGGWVVACFRTDCPESHFEPWVGDAETRADAEQIAREHRVMIRDYFSDEVCPTCGQHVPRSTDP